MKAHHSTEYVYFLIDVATSTESEFPKLEMKVISPTQTEN